MCYFVYYINTLLQGNKKKVDFIHVEKRFIRGEEIDRLTCQQLIGDLEHMKNYRK